MAKSKKCSKTAAVALPSPMPGTSVQSASAETSDPMRLTMIRPEQLAGASFVAPSTITLKFADGRLFSLAAERLGMPMDRIDWLTLQASPDGEMITVKRIKGGPIPIDSATLRYLVDEKYAATIDKSINDLHIPPAEFDEAAKRSKLSRDPRWYDVGAEDDLFE